MHYGMGLIPLYRSEEGYIIAASAVDETSSLLLLLLLPPLPKEPPLSLSCLLLGATTLL